MKEEQNEFERLLKEKADRVEMRPSPFVWQQVQHGIQKDRRRRRFAWWLFATGLFAVLSTGALFMLNNKLDQPTASSVAHNSSDRSNGVVNNSSSEKNSVEKNSPANNIKNENSPARQTSAETFSINNQQQKKVTSSKNVRRENLNEKSAVPTNRYVTGVHIDLEEEHLMAPRQVAFPSVEEEFIHTISFQPSTFDFSSAPPSNHSFLFEAEAMPLASFVWNKNTSATLPQLGLANAALPEGSNSYSFVQGFSAGGNFFLEQNKFWLYGIGLHLTKTHLEAITAQQTITVNDTTYVFDGNSYVAEVKTKDTIVYQSQHSVNQWLDVSLMAGVKLFPSSKNHLRILAGAGYSRLLSDKNSNAITPKAYDLAFGTTSGGGNTAADSTGLPMVSYYKNQLQLFSEISYLRDLTSQLSFTAGMQLHYYPMNLLNSTELSQHMMWVGLKGGLVFRF